MKEPPKKFLERLQALGIPSPPHFLMVRVADQKMTLFVDREAKATHPVSTARKGVGQKSDSYQTPLGLHRIKQKIGRDAPLGAIFSNREPTGKAWSPDSNMERGTGNTKGRTPGPEPPQHASLSVPDLVTSRILWLEGLEPGFNAGTDPEGDVVDSYQRYIYIHGTNHEDEIGKAVSRGCVRMNNSEIIALFDMVEEGDLVWIQE